jgi:hypothetical protein
MTNQISRRYIDEIQSLIAEIQISDRELFSVCQALHTLLSVLHEEVTANGGTFISMYSHQMFRNKFQDNFEPTGIIDTIDKLIKECDERIKK